MLRNPSDLNIDLIPVKEKGKRREDWRERNSDSNKLVRKFCTGKRVFEPRSPY